jgi:hypothetical protein
MQNRLRGKMLQTEAYVAGRLSVNVGRCGFQRRRTLPRDFNVDGPRPGGRFF